MAFPKTKAVFAVGVIAWLAACGEAPGRQSAQASTPSAAGQEDRAALGLMTSLPLYWPLSAEFESIAAGEAEIPWQRAVLENQYALVPLDTLSPIAGLDPQAPETDPLEGLDRIAVIQPRGLTPSDNVALDEWVRAGGQLLLVLDPMLSGQYPVALGDPRRPVDAALIPPVVKRWGLVVAFRDAHSHEVRRVPFDNRFALRSMAGEILPDFGEEPDCEYHAQAMIAQCRVGEGLVTLVADAASFEFPLDPAQSDGDEASPILTLVRFAFP